MTDKLTSIERELLSKRSEFEAEKTSLQTKLSDLLGEVQSLRSSNKVNEEKAKMIESDRDRIEKKNGDTIRGLKDQLAEMEANTNRQL